VLLAGAGDDGDLLSRSRCASRPPPYTLCIWRVTLDPFRRYRGESEKVLLPHLMTKIGFIGNLSSFALITPQVMAMRGVASGKEIITGRKGPELG
jgi:hypothetical protein